MTAHPPAQRCAKPAHSPPRPRAHPCRWSAAFILGAILSSFVGMRTAIAAQTVDPNAPVLVISITGTIDLGLASYLMRVINEAAEASAPARSSWRSTRPVAGSTPCCRCKMQDAPLDADVRTIAFVNRTAFSAGALDAIAAEEIYMVPGAVMGAATPVDGAGETASEKVISAVRKTFKTTAEVHGRDPLVAEAMVDLTVQVADIVVSKGGPTARPCFESDRNGGCESMNRPTRSGRPWPDTSRRSAG